MREPALRRSSLLSLALTLAITAVVSLPAEVSPDMGAPSGRTPPVAIPADFAGMIHAGSSSEPDREYALLDELGDVWVQRDFSWSSIEPARGQWNFTQFDDYVARANRQGKKILGMLLYDVAWVHAGSDRKGPYLTADELPRFEEYARAAVQRYNGRHGHGKVDAWCIWNEPNMSDRFWRGSKEELFALTRETAKAIRALDGEEGSHTTLLGGVFNTLVIDDPGWVTGLFESGAMEQVDGVAFHPYAPSARRSAEVFEWFRDKVARYGFADRIWVNEMGYPTAPRKNYLTEASEAEMPDRVTKTFVLLAAEGARTLFWYHLFDPEVRDASNSEDWFGLIWQRGEEWQKKGGFNGYALCARHLPGKVLAAESLPGVHLPEDTRAFYFAGRSGTPQAARRALILWNDGDTDRTITFKIPGRNRRRWSTVTGEAEDLPAETFTGTLYRDGRADGSVLFFTWDQH